MSIKNTGIKLKKMNIKNIKKICKKMKVKCTGKSKAKMIQELMLPFTRKNFPMKYRMKRKRELHTNNTKCHNDLDLQLNEFVEGRYVNLGRYCVSLEDISGMINNILTLRPTQVGSNAYTRILANPYTNNPMTPKNISDIREMLQRNNDNELLGRYETSVRERTYEEQFELSNDYISDSDSDSDSDWPELDDEDFALYNIFDNPNESGNETDIEELDIEELLSQISTEDEALEYVHNNTVTAEILRELTEKFPNKADEIEDIVIDKMRMD